jgi:flagellar hook protein FlgE
VGVAASTCATPTSRVTVAANLDAAPQALGAPWDSKDPYAQTNYVSIETIYDALGQEHALALTFRGAGANRYEYHALVDSYVAVAAEVNGTEVSAGVLSFMTNGALAAVTTTLSAPVRFEGIAAPQTIAVDFGRAVADGGTGFDSTISVRSATRVVGQWQDGAACGATVVKPTPCAWPLPQATSHLAITANLDARMDMMPVLALPWNQAAPFATSNFTLSTTVYDSVGAAHTLELYFRRTTLGTWDYHAVADEGTPSMPSAVGTEVGAGTLAFDENGELTSVSTSTLMNLSFPGATPNQVVTLDFGETTNASGQGHMTELAETSTAVTTVQDGRALPVDLLAATSICE